MLAHPEPSPSSGSRGVGAGDQTARRRRFNQVERAAMYLASDGTCSSCGCHLLTGWHGDHIQPFALGGQTDIVNGQALCPTCNLKKGSSVVNGLRTWQRTALDQFEAMGRPTDFTVSATPGAGKTTFALTLARRLLDAGIVKRVAVVVPTDGLRTQWAEDQSLVSLKTVGFPEDYTKPGFEGFVVTYQQLTCGSVGPQLCRRATSTPTLAILDEIHHAGESKSWGDGLATALALARHRLALTGTPWRNDRKSPIPFVRYDEWGKVVVDTSYEYGEAVTDGVCRHLEFHAYDGESKWQDCGKEVSADLSADGLIDEDLSAALDAALHPAHEWMAGLLRKANDALVELRADVPDAGGLVIAHDEWRARGYAEILRRITGDAPTLVVSADPDARDNLASFRTGRSPWLVAIRMVSEGVDVPRLVVGVYASKIKTPLFFRQVAGRFVRVRDGEEINARMFLPAVPSLRALAREIEEELRHQLDLVIVPEDRTGGGTGQVQLDLRTPISASPPVFDCAIFAGADITPTEFSQAELQCRRLGIPAQFAVNLVPLLRGAATPAETPTRMSPPEQETPRNVRERMLRQEIETLARRLAYRTGREPKEINADILRAGHPSRKSASLDQLEAIRAELLRWIGMVG
jgi:superfamily II DNA or RNA helicase